MAENHIFPFLMDARRSGMRFYGRRSGRSRSAESRQSAWKRARMMIFAATVGGMIWISFWMRREHAE